MLHFDCFAGFGVFVMDKEDAVVPDGTSDEVVPREGEKSTLTLSEDDMPTLYSLLSPQNPDGDGDVVGTLVADASEQRDGGAKQRSVDDRGIVVESSSVDSSPSTPAHDAVGDDRREEAELSSAACNGVDGDETPSAEQVPATVVELGRETSESASDNVEDANKVMSSSSTSSPSEPTEEKELEESAIDGVRHPVSCPVVPDEPGVRDERNREEPSLDGVPVPVSLSFRIQSSSLPFSASSCVSNVMCCEFVAGWSFRR